MSSNVDERVLQMRFDNEQFEKGIKTSIDSLGQLEKELRMDGATSGVDHAGSALSRLASTIGGCFSSMSSAASSFGSAANGVMDSVSAKGTMLRTVLVDITRDLENLAKRAVASLGVTSGFQEYETKIGSVQTIIANTDADIKEVTKSLDELNYYADKTIYNFAQMTQNIGRFTAAGVELEDATAAIKGLSNLAAFSGASPSQAANVMYQTAQALSSGTFRLMDWNSFVNSSMANKTFQNLLVQQATKMGQTAETTVETTDEKGKTKKSKKTVSVADYVAEKGFRDSLSGGWLTTDVMLSTLRIFAGEMTEAEMRSYGYSEEEIKRLTKIGQTATDAATKVRTFTQLIDTVKESMQSGWTESWEILVGDFYEATDLLTMINDRISAFVAKTSEARNNLLRGWKELGGRTQLIDDLTKLADTLSFVGTMLSASFTDVFSLDGFGSGIFDASSLKSFTDMIGTAIDKFRNFLMSANEGTHKGTVIADIAAAVRGFLSVIQIATSALSAFGSIIGSVVGPIASSIFTGVLSILAKVGDQIHQIGKGLKENETFKKFADSVKTNIAPTVERISTAITNFFNTIRENINIPEAAGKIWAWLTDAVNILTPIVSSAVEGLVSAFGKIRDGIAKFKEWFSPIAETIGNTFKRLFGIGEGNAEGNPAKTGFWQGVQKVFTWISNLFTSIYNSDVVQTAIKFFSDTKAKLSESIQGWFTGGGFDKFADSISSTFTKIKEAFNKVKAALKDNKAFESVKGFFKNLDFSGILSKEGGVLSKLKTGIKALLEPIGNFISSLFIGSASAEGADAEGVAEVAERTIEKVETVAEKAENVGEKVKNVTSSFDGVKELFSKIGEWIKGFAGNINLDSIGDVVSKVTGLAAPIVLLNWIGSFSKINKGFGSMLKNTGKTIKGFKGLGKLFKTEFTGIGGTVKELISSWQGGGILGAIKSIFVGENGSVSSLLSGFGTDGGIMGAIKAVFGDKTQEQVSVIKHVDSIGSTVLKFAAAIGILVGSLYVLTNVISADKLTEGLKALGLLAAGFAAFVGVMAFVGSKFRGVEKAGKSALMLAGALAILTGVLYAVANIPADQVEAGAHRLIGIALVVAGFMALVSASGYNGKNTKVLSLAAAILVLIGAIQMLSKMKLKTFVKGFTLLTAMLLSFGRAMRIAGKGNGVKGALSMALSIIVLTSALKSLSKLEPKKLLTGVAGLMATLLSFALFLRSVDKTDTSSTKVVALSFAIKTLASSVKSLAQLDLGQAAIGVGAMFILLSTLGKFLKTASGLGKVTGLFGIAVALTAMTIPIKMIGSMAWYEALQGVVGIGLVLAELTAMLKIANGSKISFATLMSMALALLAVTVPMKALAKMKPEEWAQSVLGIGIVVGAFALLVGLAGKLSATSVVGLTLGFIGLAGVLLVLSKTIQDISAIDTESAAVALAGVAAILLMFGVVIAASSTLQKATSVVGLVLGVVALGAAIVGMCYGLSMLANVKTDTMITALIGISALLLEIGLFIGILGSISPAAGAIAALNLVSFVGIVGLVLYGLGALENELGNVKDFLKTGGDIMYLVGEGLFKLVQGMVSLGAIGTDLSTFMTNVQPFIEGARGIGEDVGNGISTLTTAINNITDASLNEAMAGFISGGSPVKGFIDHITHLSGAIALFTSLTGGVKKERMEEIAGCITTLSSAMPKDEIPTTFGTVLSGIGAGLKDIDTSVKNIDTEKALAAIGIVTELTKSADDINTLANASSISGKLNEIGTEIAAYVDLVKDKKLSGALTASTTVSVLSGLANIAKTIEGVDVSSFRALGRVLTTVGGGLKLYANAVLGIEGITSIQGHEAEALDLVEKLIEAIPADFASKVEKIPNAEGFESFSAGMVGLGGALADFATSTKDVDQGQIEKATACLNALSAVYDNIPKVNGLLSDIFGTTDPYKFSSGLRSIGSGLKAFYESTQGLKKEKIIEAADCLDSLSTIEGKLERHGGKIQEIFGDRSLVNLGNGLTAVGTGLHNFADSVTGENALDTKGIDNATSVLESLAGLENALKNHGGILQAFEGDSDLSTFAPGLLAVGDALGQYSTKIASVNVAKAFAANLLIDQLAITESKLNKQGGIASWFEGETNFSTFANNVKDLGNGLSAYSKAVADIDVGKATDAATVADKLASVESSLNKQNNNVITWLGGQTTFNNFVENIKKLGTGLNEFAGKVTSLDSSKMGAAVDVAKGLSDIQTALSNAVGDDGWLQNFFDGEYTLDEFGSDIATLGTHLKDFSANATGLEYVSMEAGIKAIASLADIADALPSGTANDLKNWFTGDYSLKSFAAQLPDIGGYLAKFQTNLGTFNADAFYKVGAGLAALVTAVGNVGKNETGGYDVTTALSNVRDLLLAVSTAEIFSDESFNDALAGGASFVDKVAQGIIDNADAVKPPAQGLAVIAANAVNTAEIDTTSAGENLVNGIIQGINNRSGVLLKTISGLANASVFRWKAVLQIHSPSRKTKPIGKYMVKGAEVGAEEESKNFIGQIVTMAGDSIKAFNGVYQASDMWAGYTGPKGSRFGSTMTAVSDTWNDFTAEIGDLTETVKTEGATIVDGISQKFDETIDSAKKRFEGLTSLLDDGHVTQLYDLISTSYKENRGFSGTLEDVKGLIGQWVSEGTIKSGDTEEVDLFSELLNYWNDMGWNYGGLSTVKEGTPIKDDKATTDKDGKTNPAYTGEKKAHRWYGTGYHYGIGTDDYQYWTSYSDIPEEYRGKAVWKDAWVEKADPKPGTYWYKKWYGDGTTTAQTAQTTKTLADALKNAPRTLATTEDLSSILNRGQGPLNPFYATRTADQVAQELGIKKELETYNNNVLSSLATTIGTQSEQYSQLVKSTLNASEAAKTLAANVANTRIYLDSGTLVGGITQQMDVALGKEFLLGKRK